MGDMVFAGNLIWDHTHTHTHTHAEVDGPTDWHTNKYILKPPGMSTQQLPVQH